MTAKSTFAQSWTYQLIFSPSNIPLPASAPSNAVVRGVYSPNVVKVSGTFYMFFGVSIYCQSGTVARDSIAVATSSNGTNWVFDKYVLEPDPTVCFAAQSTWVPNALIQVNDPAVVYQNGEFLVFYTAALYNTGTTGQGCGNLGFAELDNNLNLVQRNEHYLDAPAGTCNMTTTGVSRPALEQTSQLSFKLWYDISGHVYSRWIMNLTNIDQVTQEDSYLTGTPDIEVTDLAGSTNIVFTGGVSGIQFNYRIASPGQTVSGASDWYGWTGLIPLSQQGWDKDGQGSPFMYEDTSSCSPVFYFSGTVLNAQKTDYQSLNIGLALPPAGSPVQSDWGTRRCQLLNSFN